MSHPNNNQANIIQAKQLGKVFNGQGALKRKAYSLPRLSECDRRKIERAKTYAREILIASKFLANTIAAEQKKSSNEMESEQRQQTVAIMCRIYIGSINFVINEMQVKETFSPLGPIKNLNMPFDNILKHHKGFAFLEYEVPEAAFLAIEHLNGTSISGFSIKVGRPSNMPQPTEIVDKIMKEANGHPRIYVSNIPQNINEDNLKSVFVNFGTIKSCQMPVDPMMPAKHKGYAYITYEDVAQADVALYANNLCLGGNSLKVCRAVTPPVSFAPPTSSMPMASAVAVAAVSARIQEMEALGINFV